MTPIRIVLADDHPIVREGFRSLLEAQPGFVVVGEASDGNEVMPLVERLRPDVLVVDVQMPNLNGLEAAHQVPRKSPDTHVVILSMHANEAYVAEALRAGAAGYVLKGSTAADLIHAIHEAMAGRRYLSPPLTDRLIDAYLHKVATEALEPYDMLTAREREVLRMTAEGRTTNQVASALSISPRTVERHRANLMRKLELNSQAALIRYALQRGLVPLDDDPS